jgi:hypothetical protein
MLQAKRADGASITKNRRTLDKPLKQEADRLVFEESRNTAEVVRNLSLDKEIVIRGVTEFKENPIDSLLKQDIDVRGPFLFSI